MLFSKLLSLTDQSGTPLALLLALIARIVVLVTPSGFELRGRFRFAGRMLLTHLVLLATALGMFALQMSLARGIAIGAVLVGTLASVTLGRVVLEGFVLRVRRFPQIVSDLVTSVVAFIAVMHVSSQLGFELSGVIATSAVVTAVLGFALQDTLGNALGGLALQLDASIRVGDRVRIGSVAGRVSEIHWRYTAIETGSWDTVIIPNREVMRSQVVVIGRRGGKPPYSKRTVSFQVDYHHAPGDVVQVIEQALLSQRIPNVASEPPPSCVALEFEASQTRYAVRYLLTDLSADDTTDSQVRNCIYYALARAKIGLAIPAQSVIVTTDDEARDEQKRAREQEQRIVALRRIDLFAGLSKDELHDLGERLERAPFARDETITREGGTARHLYMILSGSVSVRVGGLEQGCEVARLKAGDFFGEMGLLTGAHRRATSVAITDVECYRLDADAFRALLARRPDLAERVAGVLAEREVGLMAARERLGAEQHARLMAQKERAFVSKIRAFFELS